MGTKDKRIQTPYDDLTYRVIGCAMSLHRTLGPGYRENTYQRGLANHLVEAHLSFEEQKLAVTNFTVGLLINFGERSLKYRRILPPKNVSYHRFNRQWLFVLDWLKGE